MAGFLGDALKKYQIKKQESFVEDHILRVIQEYNPACLRKHIRYNKGIIHLVGLSAASKTHLLLRKQEILTALKESSLFVRDIL